MSRIVRKQLFSIWESLQEAYQVIGNLIENQEKEEAINLLADCQEGAITIGNQIEAVYGEGYECIRQLEHYCETAYHMVENIDNYEACMDNYAAAGQQLLVIKEAMGSEIPDKLEVVFFPYKASMWDSLESIYLAAAEDKECDAYCVPIPYYDLNPDKSFREFHDESGEYPENIPVISWQEYEFEVRKPDIIFIHNPYDNWNTVTSVEPRFYASNLRKYTEKLVYVPYFVLDDIKPDDEGAIENMKHFCFLPGIVYADKVIVQSENMRRIYINEYVKAAQEQGIMVDEVALDDKILGLGSPKFDKIQNADSKQIILPKEWEKIMQKTNGEKKKAILYNISINDLLANREKMFTKIRSVLRMFCEKQDEVALWFRPHPLIQSTLKAMRPELWDEYMEIIEQYRKEGWGIYDDTADLDRAIQMTDAYYGDWSSVVWVYQKANKLVMIQDVSILNDMKECD